MSNPALPISFGEMAADRGPQMVAKFVRLSLLLALAAIGAAIVSAILAATALGWLGTLLAGVVFLASLRHLIESIRNRAGRSRAIVLSSFLLLVLHGSLSDNRLKALARDDPEAYRLKMAERAAAKAEWASASLAAEAERKNAKDKSNREKAERERCRDEIEALTYAQLAVEQKLISPKSADFPWSGAKTHQISCGRWTVASYVDSQNAFGATVRNHWAAEMRWVPESRAWVAEYVRFD